MNDVAKPKSELPDVQPVNPDLTAAELNTILFFLNRSRTNGLEESVGLVEIVKRLSGRFQSLTAERSSPGTNGI